VVRQAYRERQSKPLARVLIVILQEPENKITISKQRKQKMNVFDHHVYEYRKGIRRLILHTDSAACQPCIECKLRRKNIAHLIYPLGANKINVFLGDDVCIEVIRKFNKQHLFELTDEEDFILGIMLGYDTAKQCGRYLGRTARTTVRISRHAA
jgi:hypothetical protein